MFRPVQFTQLLRAKVHRRPKLMGNQVDLRNMLQHFQIVKRLLQAGSVAHGSMICQQDGIVMSEERHKMSGDLRRACGGVSRERHRSQRHGGFLAQNPIETPA